MKAMKLVKMILSTNYHNYARWMILYTLEFLNLKSENPHIAEMLRNGGFTINRTGNPFGDVDVDMVLEQTINAEAKNRLRGIMAYIDISTAVNRWITTNSMQKELVSQVLEIDFEKFIDCTRVTQTRITKDKHDLEMIKAVIKKTLNLFNEAISKNVLFSIKTGRTLQRNGAEYLLTIKDEGKKRRDAFIKDCTERSSQFEEPIKKLKILNFAAKNILKKNKSKQVAEIANIKGFNDMFGCLLYLSVRKNIDLNIVFQYPLLPEPPCFINPDGSLRESKKSSVIHFLKEKIDYSSPSNVNTVIADGIIVCIGVSTPLQKHYPLFLAKPPPPPPP